MRSTVARRLSTLASFSRYCHVEGILERNPAANVRRPKVDGESRTLGLDRNELGTVLVQAGLGSPRDHALISRLALNGLRVGEALGPDIEKLDIDRGHRTLAIYAHRRHARDHPARPTHHADPRSVLGERTSGPIFVGVNRQRMDRYAADRTVKRLAKRAGITKRISSHSLRHSFITAALDAGVPLRDVQEAASHADPRTTMRHDRAHQSLDRHAHRCCIRRRRRTHRLTTRRDRADRTDRARHRRQCATDRDVPPATTSGYAHAGRLRSCAVPERVDRRRGRESALFLRQLSACGNR